MHEQMFENLREEALLNITLAAPDFKKRFCVECDASYDGWGSSIYQLKDITVADTPANRNVIKYESGSWSPAMRDRPPYYREGDVLVTAMIDGCYYARASPSPLLCWSDQAPLQWIKTTSKGAVTAWRIMHLNDKDYEVKHRPGRFMQVPDTLSRYPMIGRRTRTRVDIKNAVDVLLRSLPDSTKEIHRMWVWASQDTTEIARIAQE
jgi:hypothetical protein